MKLLGVHIPLGLSVLALALVFVVLTTGRAQAAAPTGKWIDAADISYNNVKYAKTQINGNLMSLTDPAHKCNTITVGDTKTSYQDATSATLTLNPNCIVGPIPTQIIQLSNTYKDVAAATSATWTDTTHITYDGHTFTFVPTPPAGDGIGPLDMELAGNDTTCGTLKIIVKDYLTATTASYESYTGPLCVKTFTPLTLTNTQPAPPSPTPTPPTGNNGNGDDGCQLTGPLSWIACPVITLLGDAIGVLSSALENALYIPVDQFFGSNSPVQQPFNTFRNIAVALLVAGGLVMVISEAAGFEVFAAYTIRKTLPRIVIAIIGISLAWPILKFGITLSNDLGLWMNSLIVGAFPHPGNAGVGGFDQAMQGIVTMLIPVGAVAVGADAIITGSGGIVGSLLLTLLVTLFIGYLILALRQMVILVGIIIAPLAIAASILPGTFKLWDFWEDSMLGALAMFPIIMAFLGAGTALSNVAQAEATAPNVGAGAAITWTIMAVFILIGALVLVPVSFRIASGIVRTAHSVLTGSQLSKGFFAKQKEYRGEKRAEGRQKFLEGERYAGTLGQKTPWRGLGKFGGNLGAFMNSGDKLGYLSNKDGARDEANRLWSNTVEAGYAKRGRTMASAYMTDAHYAQAAGSEEVARKTLAADHEWFTKNANGSYYTTRNGREVEVEKGENGEFYERGRVNNAAARVQRKDIAADTDRVNRAIVAAHSAGGFGFAAQQYAVDQLAANGDYTDARDMWVTIDRASGNNKALRDSHVGTVRGLMERSGLGHTKAGFKTMIDYGDKFHEGTATQEDFDNVIIEGVRSMDNASLSRLKSKGMREATEVLTRSLDRNFQIVNTAPVDSAEYKTASIEVGRIQAKLDNLVGAAKFGYAPEINQEILVDATTTDDYDSRLKKPIDLASRPRVVQVKSANNAPLTPPPNGQVQVQLQQQRGTAAPQQVQVQFQGIPGQVVQPGQPQTLWVQQAPNVQVGNTPVQMVNAQGNPIRTTQQPPAQSSAPQPQIMQPPNDFMTRARQNNLQSRQFDPKDMLPPAPPDDQQAA